MAKVLITGATGFIGSRLALRLRDHGYQVTGFARPSTRARRLEREDIEFFAGDIRDGDAVAHAVKGHQIVVHLAAAYRVEAKPLDFFYATNVNGTRNVLAACIKHEVARVIHASTTGVYGVLQELPASEDHPYGFTDHYQQTKIQGERLARDAFNGPLMDRGVIVRPTGMYGPHDTRVLKLVRALKRKYFFFPGPCRNLYHPTYIDDALDAFELAITKEAALGQSYNLAGFRYLPLREYIRTIVYLLHIPEPRVQAPLWPLKVAARVCGGVGRVLRIEPPLYPRRLGFFYFDRAFSIDKARRELGYEPVVDVGDGLARTMAWWRSQALL